MSTKNLQSHVPVLTTSKLGILSCLPCSPAPHFLQYLLRQHPCLGFLTILDHFTLGQNSVGPPPFRPKNEDPPPFRRD
jgi:hypothetical protein